jgi:hypothetical protein
MTTPDKIKLIESLVASYKEMDAVCDQAKSLMGVGVDSKLFNPFWKAFDGYVGAVSKLVGDAGAERLCWFIWENGCGEKGMKAGYNEKLRPVKTVKQLVALIEKGKL